MPRAAERQIESIKLTDGRRVRRLSEPKLGLALEKTLDPALPLVRQKNELVAMFEAVLARAVALAS